MGHVRRRKNLFPLPFLFGAGAFIAAALPGCDSRMPVSRSEPAPQVPDDLDGRTLKQLRKAGSDLSKPHNIEFFLYFPSRESAERAGQKIKQLGLDTKVTPSAAGGRWLCFGTKSMVPNYQALAALRSKLERIAKSENGEYDGWGTEVQE